VEAGVPFVEAYLGDWDSHEKRRADLVRNTLLPVSDQAITALLTDLIDRDMLDDTLVVWMGEFGRTPECGPDANRQHFDKAWSTVLFGGGVRGGQVIGRTDAKGGEVVDRPVSGPDFMATVLSLLGLDPKSDLYAGSRPVRMVAPGGEPIKELERV
jgi:arylsulfatase A-like enzyme